MESKVDLCVWRITWSCQKSYILSCPRAWPNKFNNSRWRKDEISSLKLEPQSVEPEEVVRKSTAFIQYLHCSEYLNCPKMNHLFGSSVSLMMKLTRFYKTESAQCLDVWPKRMALGSHFSNQRKIRRKSERWSKDFLWTQRNRAVSASIRWTMIKI